LSARNIPATTIGCHNFAWGSRTYLMGIVNVTPDSFSDGGKHLDSRIAVEAGIRLVEEGADILDIGGESTRPGSLPVTAEEELKRVLPVITQLRKQVKVPISIDTTKALVARHAVEAGADLVNDISGLRFDSQMAPTCAELGAAICIMHIRGVPRHMQDHPSYQDVVSEVLQELQQSLAIAQSAGIPSNRILVDPGIGFGKTLEHNLALLKNLKVLRSLGHPVLVGVSRKSFIGKLTNRTVEQRLSGSIAALAACVMQGADIIRVHDVVESVAAAKIVDALYRH
jgi:dihydropteroate synthase